MKVIRSEGRDPKVVARESFESEEGQGFMHIHMTDPDGKVHEVDREEVSGSGEAGPSS